MKNKLFMKNFVHVLKQEKNRMLCGVSERFIDLMLESEDGEIGYLAELIEVALTMTLTGKKYYIELDEDGMYNPNGIWREE